VVFCCSGARALCFVPLKGRAICLSYTCIHAPAVMALGYPRPRGASAVAATTHLMTLLDALQVFDVELRAVRNCRRRQVAMFSDVVCE
jgi:hypothetical protein